MLTLEDLILIIAIYFVGTVITYIIVKKIYKHFFKVKNESIVELVAREYTTGLLTILSFIGLFMFIVIVGILWLFQTIDRIFKL